MLSGFCWVGFRAPPLTGEVKMKRCHGNGEEWKHNNIDSFFFIVSWVTDTNVPLETSGTETTPEIFVCVFHGVLLRLRPLMSSVFCLNIKPSPWRHPSLYIPWIHDYWPQCFRINHSGAKPTPSWDYLSLKTLCLLFQSEKWLKRRRRCRGGSIQTIQS